jgi:type I restriction enzyme, S subunit
LNNPSAVYNYFQGAIEDQYKVENGDILVSWSASLDTYVWNNGPAVLNQHIFKVVPNEKEVDKDFLFFLLKRAMKGLTDLVHGATMKHVNRPVFEGFEVSFPKDIDHQKALASSLKEGVQEIERARTAASLQLREVDNLANAIIYDSLNRSGLANYNLGQVLDEVKNGIGNSWKDYPVYGATRKGIALAKEPPGKNPQRYKPIISGTVFYNPMRILIGSIAFAEDDVEDGITSPDYVVLKGKEGLVNSRWFYYWLRSPLGQDCINSLARGAVRERMLFNRLAEGNIDLPNYTVQEKAAEALQNLKQVRANLNMQFQEIAALPNRLLSNFFQEV